jgi:hypothetical protein
MQGRPAPHRPTRADERSGLLQPSAALEVDDKGVHVRFDRPAGGASYVFLNNEGASGVVLIDTNGVRRLEAVLAPNGEPIVRRFDVGGQAMP